MYDCLYVAINVAETEMWKNNKNMKIKKLLKTLNYNFYKCAVCYDEFNVINDHTLGRKRGGFIYFFTVVVIICAWKGTWTTETYFHFGICQKGGNCD